MTVEGWHRRQALQLASQLPENAADANVVIRELQYLVDTWLHPVSDTPSNVVSLVREKVDL